MVYRKQTTKKWNKPYKKGGRRAYSYGMALKQLGRDVGKLKGLINVEFKYIDTALESTVNSSGTLQLLNAASKGDGSTDRDGNSVRYKSAQANGWCKIHASATASTVRRILFIDTQPNEAAPTIGDLLQNTFQYPIAMRQLAKRKRFVILQDDQIFLSANGNQILPFPKLYRQLDMITIYNGDAGTIADIETNSLYLLYVSNEATNTPTISHGARLRFIDN